MRKAICSCAMVLVLAIGTVVGVRMVLDARSIGPVHVGETDVAVRLSGFGPNAIQVPIGTTVRWTFADGVTHDVRGDGGITSPQQDHGTYLHTFSAAGSFEYHCSLHPIMRGRVIVVR